MSLKTLIVLCLLSATLESQANLRCKELFKPNTLSVKISDWWQGTSIGQKQLAKKALIEQKQQENDTLNAFTNFSERLQMIVESHKKQGMHTPVEISKILPNPQLFISTWNSNRYVKNRPISNRSMNKHPIEANSTQFESYFLKTILSFEKLVDKSLEPLNIEQQIKFLSFFLRSRSHPTRIYSDKHQYELTIDQGFKSMKHEYWFVFEQYVEAYAIQKLAQINTMKSLRVIASRINESSPIADQAKAYIEKMLAEQPELTRKTVYDLILELGHERFIIKAEFGRSRIGPMLRDMDGTIIYPQQYRIDQITETETRLKELIEL